MIRDTALELGGSMSGMIAPLQPTCLIEEGMAADYDPYFFKRNALPTRAKSRKTRVTRANAGTGSKGEGWLKVSGQMTGTRLPLPVPELERPERSNPGKEHVIANPLSERDGALSTKRSNARLAQENPVASEPASPAASAVKIAQPVVAAQPKKADIFKSVRRSVPLGG